MISNNFSINFIFHQVLSSYKLSKIIKLENVLEKINTIKTILFIQKNIYLIKSLIIKYLISLNQ